MFAVIVCKHAALLSHSSMSIYQNLFLQTLFLWPQTAGWLLCRSHTPEQRRGTSAIQEHEIQLQHACNRRPSPTSWYFSRAMLVSAASGVSMKISLFFWMFSRIPWKCANTQSPSSVFGYATRYICLGWNIKLLENWSNLRITQTHLFIPGGHDVLHVNIAGEKCHNAIRNNGRHL